MQARIVGAWVLLPFVRENRLDLEGRFADFDIPTLILEAKWDLTWNTDKPAKMLKNHPGAKMLVFENSGHSLFADEPEKFSEALKDLVKTAKAAPAPAAGRMGAGVPWPPPIVGKIDVLPWTGAGKQALDVFVEAKAFTLTDDDAWVKLGMALYDGKYYSEALEAFQRVGLSEKSEAIVRFVSLVWQGQLLDLLGRRDEALDRYGRALKLDIGGSAMRHDQYGMIINRKWAEERLKTPFVRKPE